MNVRRTPEARPAAAEGDVFGGDTPFRRRLLLAALIAGLGFIGVAGGLAWHQYDGARKSDIDDARARVILAGTLVNTYFGGELATLSSIADSPPVLARDEPAMRAYFERVQPPGGGLFSGGMAWIDTTGVVRVSSNGERSTAVDVADRSYFRTVMTTGGPFVSEGLTSRRTHRDIVVMAVPTHDTSGRITGVLTGALLVNSIRARSGSFDLGFSGLVVLDRDGRAVLGGFTRPRNVALQRRLQQRQLGLIADTRGLDGGNGHLVTFATAQIPGWTIVIDRPRSAIFAAAWRALALELALIAFAAAIVFGLIGWLLLRARRDAERQTARARQRGELSHALSAASLAGEVARGLATGLVTAFPGALSIVSLEAGDRLGLELTAAGEGAWPLSPAAGDLVVSQASMRAYEAGVPLALASEERLRAELPELQAALGDEWRSLYAAPLRTPGSHPAGAVCLLFAGEHSLDEAERAHVEWYAAEAAQALDRARTYEHEHAVAVSLQRSLLSQELPAIDGVDLLGSYQAGSAGLEVGGDWYDVIRRSDGIVLITVGDVAGRGLGAAVLMGQMRNAFRAYAFDHASPAEVLRRMRRHISGDEMATAVCIAIDPYTRELTYASAGHPPALLLDGEHGTVSRLDCAGAPPLGFTEADAIRETAIALPARATVVAYTDGLIERRDWTIDIGIDLLADVLAASPGLSGQALASAIDRDVAGRVGSGDDIALLIVRVLGVPERMEVEVPADPAALAGLRRRLRAWLSLRGVSEQERDDAVLSISEACNNAIEHGYHGASGTINVLLEHRALALEISVADRGTWRPPPASADRGRGIGIMRAVMHDARIECEPGGTRVLLSRRLSS